MREQGVRSAYITRDKDLAQLMRDGDLFWTSVRASNSAITTSNDTSVCGPSASRLLALTGDEVETSGRPGCRTPHRGLAHESLRFTG